MENSMWGQETRYFHQLTPEAVLLSSEILGQRLTGRIMPLNSLENRVYDIELAGSIEAGEGFSSRNIVVKFYRPGRWSKEQILEEHSFLGSLSEFEVPVVSPIEIQGKTLHLDQDNNLWFALFPKVQGRLKDEFNKEETEQAGRLIGRIHNIGGMGTFKHRLAINPTTFVKSSQEQLRSLKIVEYTSYEHYLTLLDSAFKLLEPFFSNITIQRLHGDFHRGNIVWTTKGPVAVDFDDCLSGPVEQDLWLLFPGRDSYSLEDRERFLNAYKEMTRKEFLKINLTEVFRTMRMIHFNAWLAKRWEDHSFKKVFPQFISANYWDQQLIDLRQQISLISEIHLY